MGLAQSQERQSGSEVALCCTSEIRKEQQQGPNKQKRITRTIGFLYVLFFLFLFLLVNIKSITKKIYKKESSHACLLKRKRNKSQIKNLFCLGFRVQTTSSSCCLDQGLAFTRNDIQELVTSIVHPKGTFISVACQCSVKPCWKILVFLLVIGQNI